MPTIDVNVPNGSYRIHIDAGMLDHLGEIVAGATPSRRALLAVDSKIALAHGRKAKATLEAAGFAVTVHDLVADERRKTLETVRPMYDAMLDAKMERASPVVALGGGVVGDVAGFAAATYLRGVPLIQVPTTLLAMVDASIGGKTGVNFPLPSTARPAPLGKNLIGSFWQPQAVVVDPRVLTTLPVRDFRCGLAESVKHGVLGDAALLEFIEDNADRIASMEASILAELIARSAAVKVAIVEEDVHESSRRALLNLGHTFAHVVEPIEAQDLRHGEAVAIGLRAAAHCAVTTGDLTEADATKIRRLLERVGLPTSLRREQNIARLIEAMGYDKKVAQGTLRLVLPTGLGSAELVAAVPRDAIESAWRSVGAAGPVTRRRGRDAAEGPVDPSSDAETA